MGSQCRIKFLKGGRIRVNDHDTGKRCQTNWGDVDKLGDSESVDPESPELDETFWQQAIFVPEAKH